MSWVTQVPNGPQLAFAYGAVTRYGSAFQRILLAVFVPCLGSYYPNIAGTMLVWALPRSLATTCGIIVIFFSYGYLDVSVPRVGLPLRYSLSTGLPHSEIHGSMAICASPWLFAAYHVLLRLREPRHPPCALFYFLHRLRFFLKRDAVG